MRMLSTSSELDLVVTVCAGAAAKVCPVWPGTPLTAHWDLPDPAAFAGTEAETRTFFARIYREIENRVLGLVSLPVETLDRGSLQAELREIGHMGRELA
jgi:arsenate reductase